MIATASPSHGQRCRFGSCYRPVAVSPSGASYDFCGKTHANAYVPPAKKTRADSAERPRRPPQHSRRAAVCQLGRCDKAAFVDSPTSEVHAYCSRAHAAEANRVSATCAASSCLKPVFTDAASGVKGRFCSRYHMDAAASAGVPKGRFRGSAASRLPRSKGAAKSNLCAIDSCSYLVHRDARTGEEYMYCSRSHARQGKAMHLRPPGNPPRIQERPQQRLRRVQHCDERPQRRDQRSDERPQQRDQRFNEHPQQRSRRPSESLQQPHCQEQRLQLQRHDQVPQQPQLMEQDWLQQQLEPSDVGIFGELHDLVEALQPVLTSLSALPSTQDKIRSFVAEHDAVWLRSAGLVHGGIALSTTMAKSQPYSDESLHSLKMMEAGEQLKALGFLKAALARQTVPVVMVALSEALLNASKDRVLALLNDGDVDDNLQHLVRSIAVFRSAKSVDSLRESLGLAAAYLLHVDAGKEPLFLQKWAVRLVVDIIAELRQQQQLLMSERSFEGAAARRSPQWSGPRSLRDLDDLVGLDDVKELLHSIHDRVCLDRHRGTQVSSCFNAM